MEPPTDSLGTPSKTSGWPWPLVAQLRTPSTVPRGDQSGERARGLEGTRNFGCDQKEEGQVRAFTFTLLSALLLLGGTRASYANPGGHGRHRHNDYSRHGHDGGHSYHYYHHAWDALVLGWGFFGSPYRYPTARVPDAPPTYIQQPNYWYYCTNPKGYYPYVDECPRGWMQVVPQRPQQ